MKEKGKKIGHYSPEISLFISQVLVLVSCYLVFMKRSESWLITTLAVSAALAFINLTILHYMLRPVKIHDPGPAIHGPGYAWSAALALLFISGASLVPPALLMHSPLGAAIMIMSFGGGWALFLFIALLIVKKSEGPAHKLFGNFRISHIGALLFGAVAVSSWFLAEWNPSVPHYRFRGEVVKVKGISGISPGDPCTADISWFREGNGKPKCRSSFSCGGKRLFGSIGMGIFPCRMSYSGNSLFVRGADNSVSDGDPAFSINTETSVILYSTKKPLPAHPELEARIVTK